MKTKIQYTILLAVTVLLASCQSEQDPFNLSSNKGSFALNLNSGEIVVNTETRAALSATEAANYNIMVYQNNDELWDQKKKYSDLTGSDYILSVGSGYAVYAESCPEENAETVNNGFGCKRFAGKSAYFAIEPSKVTEVSVDCEPTNGGLCVVFDQSFTSTFGRYSVETTDENRHLIFNGDNKTTFDTAGNRTGGAVAYFNMPPAGELDIPLEVHARGAQIVPKTVTVKKGMITRLKVYGPAGSGDNTGTIDIEIEIDDDFGNIDNPVIID